MTTLTINEWDKSQRDGTVVGWSPANATVMLLSGDGRQQVMRLMLPHLARHGWSYSGQVFPDSLPISVEAIRLTFPPCCATEAKAGELREAAKNWSIDEPTKYEPRDLAWARVGGEILYPQPSDKDPLSAHLDAFKEQKRREYEEKRRHLIELTLGQYEVKRIMGELPALYLHLPVTVENARKYMEEELLKLDVAFNSPFRGEVIPGFGPMAGYLHWNLEIAIRHAEFLNPFLHAKWAKCHDVDAAQMERERADFLKFIQHNTFSGPKVGRAAVVDDILRLVGPKVSLSSAGQLGVASHQASFSDEVLLAAQVRYAINFSDGTRLWLSGYNVRAPQNANERQEFAVCKGLAPAEQCNETEPVLSKLDSMDKKLDSVAAQTTKTLAGVQNLSEMAGEQEATRDKWAENPLGCREAVADYLLKMDAMKIDRNLAVALVRFGYGDTRKECADAAKVSEATIKRALKLARQTPYGSFFARTRPQKLAARKAMKKPDEAYARLSNLAKEDPDALRSLCDQLIAKAQEGDDQYSWEKTLHSSP